MKKMRAATSKKENQKKYRKASGIDKTLLGFLVDGPNMKDQKSTDTQTSGGDKSIDD